MKNSTSRRIAAHYIYYRHSLIPNPILSLSSDGLITGIEFREDLDSLAGVEFYSGILVPAFINAHNHVELSYMKGVIPGGGGFVSFANHMGSKRHNFSEEDKRAAVLAADAKMYRDGVGAVADISNSSISFETKKSSNIHYHTYLELFGLQWDNTDHMIDVAKQAYSLGIPYSVTPHSTYLLSERGFASAVEGLYFDGKATNGNPLSIHFMESAAEAELFQGRGEMAEWNDIRGMSTDFSRWNSPADRIIAQVPSSQKTLLIHNCFVTEEVVDKLTDHFGSNVTWVLCPRSNDYISRVQPPYEMLRRKGVRIAVGTDSLASNHSLSMIDELKMLGKAPLTDLLSWACRNGAEALDLEDELGEIEVGKRCGIVLISGINWQNMSLTPESKSERLV